MISWSTEDLEQLYQESPGALLAMLHVFMKSGDLDAMGRFARVPGALTMGDHFSMTAGPAETKVYGSLKVPQMLALGIRAARNASTDRKAEFAGAVANAYVGMDEFGRPPLRDFLRGVAAFAGAGDAEVIRRVLVATPPKVVASAFAESVTTMGHDSFIERGALMVDVARFNSFTSLRVFGEMAGQNGVPELEDLMQVRIRYKAGMRAPVRLQDDLRLAAAAVSKDQFLAELLALAPVEPQSAHQMLNFHLSTRQSRHLIADAADEGARVLLDAGAVDSLAVDTADLSRRSDQRETAALALDKLSAVVLAEVPPDILRREIVAPMQLLVKGIMQPSFGKDEALSEPLKTRISSCLEVLERSGFGLSFMPSRVPGKEVGAGMFEDSSIKFQPVLHQLCAHGMLHAAEFLVEIGADPHQKDGRGFRATSCLPKEIREEGSARLLAVAARRAAGLALATIRPDAKPVTSSNGASP